MRAEPIPKTSRFWYLRCGKDVPGWSVSTCVTFNLAFPR